MPKRHPTRFDTISSVVSWFPQQTRFRRLLAKVNSVSIEQLDYRRERQVYLLTNGKRTVGQIADLLGIAPIEVAHMMKHLLEQEYVEFAPFDEDEMQKTR